MLANVSHGKPFFGLLEDEGPEEGQLVCELTEEEYYEAARHGNRVFRIDVVESAHQASPTELERDGGEE